MIGSTDMPAALALFGASVGRAGREGQRNRPFAAGLGAADCSSL